jgi:hypothetical protein
MTKFIDLTGKKFNRLTVVERVNDYISPNGFRSTQWKCICECGNEVIVSTSHLRSGHTKSCGCYGREVCVQNGLKIKHGLKESRVYRIWSCMKNRCYNQKDDNYKYYGGRGITVCDEWKDDFQTFYDWSMSHGYTDNLTIDRINVNGNYEPSNCRWATHSEQGKNKRNVIFITFEGETKTLREWSEITGIKYITLFYRYKTGKTPVEILKK